MGIFQRLLGGGERTTRKGALRVAAFGKHPGWDDHIPGIGIESEILATVKQVLYVRGIGGQIDSGAWEKPKLEFEKRLEGFDHSFLWLTQGHSILGSIWASTDRKGRSKYPMIVCVQSDGSSSEFLLESVRPELQRLRDACKATSLAEQVATECNTSQARLEALLSEATNRSVEKSARSETRQRFLDCADLGPDRQGLLRILHELNNAVGQSRHSSKAAKSSDLRPRHLRVPLCADPSRSNNQAMVLWTSLLRCALPQGASLLILSRNGVDWLDVVIGEPASDDFFCLQASPKALPLATAIPYEVSPELKPRLQELETKFLGNTAPAIAPDPLPSAVESGSAPKATQPDATGPTFETRAASGSVQPPRSGHNYVLFFGGAALIAIIGLGAYLFMLRQQQGPKLAAAQLSAKPTSASPQPTESAVPVLKAGDTQERTLRFRDSLTAGKNALAQKNYSLAVQSLTNALALVPEDPEARDLFRKAQEEEQQARAESEKESAFAQALAAAKQALEAKQIEKAQTHLQKALAFKPNDPRAVAISADVSRLQQSLKADDFNKTLAASRQALANQNFDQAIALAKQALSLMPNQAEATQLLAQASQAKESDAAYKSAMAAARRYFAQSNFDDVIQQAKTALKFNPGDPAAKELIAQADQEKTRLAKLEADRQAFKGSELDAAAKVADTERDASSTTRKNGAIAQPIADQRATSSVAAKAAGDSLSSGSSTDLEKYDTLLRNLLIELHVKPQGRNIVTNRGTATPLPKGILSRSSIDQYLKTVENLRNAYKTRQSLDAERTRNLDKLKDAILYWNL
jgi:tetratricopeptide (TPR) repeat protein